MQKIKRVDVPATWEPAERWNCPTCGEPTCRDANEPPRNDDDRCIYCRRAGRLPIAKAEGR